MDLEALAVATRLISRELDDRDPVPGRYQLEVSSPGLERPLRTPDHFRQAVGQTVTVRLHPGARSRVAGRVVEADEEAVTVEPEGEAGRGSACRYTDIERARTTFSWGGQPSRARDPAPCARLRATQQGDSMSNIDMVEAVRMLAADRGIPVDTLLQVLADALVTAYKRRPDAADEAEVQIDAETMDMRIYAYDIDEYGELVNGRDDTPDDMGRIAAQTFRQVLSQRIREVERDRKFEEYANREGDIVTGIVQQLDNRYTLLDLGKVEALLPQAEQVPFERPEAGARLKAYIVEVRRTPKGPQIVVSRTHPGLIKRLFELEVPEIADGIVEIKACAREPGHRTKMAVWSNDHNVDPVGACVGARGARVRMVVNELRGEKIDIVPFSEDQPDFVAKALSPAKVKEVRIHEDTGVAEVIVPDFQLSLAIGREGQNARLAARLTGWRVDIKSETQRAEEDAGIYRSDGATSGRKASSTPRASGCRTRSRASSSGTRPTAPWSAPRSGRPRRRCRRGRGRGRGRDRAERRRPPRRPPAPPKRPPRRRWPRRWPSRPTWTRSRTRPTRRPRIGRRRGGPTTPPPATGAGRRRLIGAARRSGRASAAAGGHPIGAGAVGTGA